jgi:hypothetical protein
VYKKILVGDYIEHGRAMLETLQRNNFTVTEAFWYELPDLDEWRLIIASPMVHLVGPTKAYTVLDRVLRQIQSPLSLGDISLLSPLSSEYQALRQAALGPGRLGMGPATEHAHDITFHDAYLYNLPASVQTR